MNEDTSKMDRFQTLCNPHAFLTLCNPHDSIIYQFGIEHSCLRKAGLCNKGCIDKAHMVANLNHEFISAKELYELISYTKEQYAEFRQHFIDTCLEQYLAHIIETINTFKQFLIDQYLKDHPLIDYFCTINFNLSENVIELISDPLQSFQIADLTCKDVFQIKKISTLLLQDKCASYREKSCDSLIKNAFQQFLRKQNLIINEVKETTDKSPEQRHFVIGSMIEVLKLFELRDVLKFRCRKYDLQKQNGRLIIESIIKVHQNFNEQLIVGIQSQVTKDITVFQGVNLNAI